MQEIECSNCKQMIPFKPDERVVCPHCDSDYGIPMTLETFNRRMREAYPRLGESDA